jgi:hypothetical protein
MANRLWERSTRPQTAELDLYSWRSTRAQSDVTLRSVLNGIGKVADAFLTLIPALVALLFILQAAHMAEQPSPTQRPARLEMSVNQPGR